MNTAQRIQTMISDTMSADDILLVLISGNVVYTKNDVLFDSLLVYKKGFIDQTWDLDFLNSRQNFVEDVRCCLITQPVHFHHC